MRKQYSNVVEQKYKISDTSVRFKIIKCLKICLNNFSGIGNFCKMVRSRKSGYKIAYANVFQSTGKQHINGYCNHFSRIQRIDIFLMNDQKQLEFIAGSKKMCGLPGGSVGKESYDCNAGDTGSIPGLERTPGEGNGNPLQYSYLENPMDREA